MLDMDDTRRPSAEQLYKKFITWGGDETAIELQPAMPISLVPTNAALSYSSEEASKELPLVPTMAETFRTIMGGAQSALEVLQPIVIAASISPPSLALFHSSN